MFLLLLFDFFFIFYFNVKFYSGQYCFFFVFQSVSVSNGNPTNFMRFCVMNTHSHTGYKYREKLRNFKENENTYNKWRRTHRTISSNKYCTQIKRKSYPRKSEHSTGCCAYRFCVVLMVLNTTSSPNEFNYDQLHSIYSGIRCCCFFFVRIYAHVPRQIIYCYAYIIYAFV